MELIKDGSYSYLSDGKHINTIDIQSALTTYGLIDDVHPQDLVYHKDSWYLTINRNQLQGQDRIIKFNFNETSDSISISDEYIFDM